MKNKIILGYALEEHGNPLTCQITQEDFDRLTHINVAFGRVMEDQGIDTQVVGDADALIEKLRAGRGDRDVKIVLSLVGEFSKAAESEENRKRLALSCVDAINRLGLDGIDFDWEFPCVPSNGLQASPADKENFTLLCKTVRETLDENQPQGVHWLFTIAAGGDQFYLDFTEMDKVQQYLDYVCLMTYDLKCGFHAITGHHTNLYLSTGDIIRSSCDTAIKAFEKAGVPSEKLLMGAAFYSRMWENIPNRCNGFLQLAKTGGGYGPDYTALVSDYIDKNGYTRYWDDEAKAPYLFNGSTFISYDDEQSIAAKCDYIKENNVGGIFYWQHSYDLTGTLLKLMDEKLNQ